VMVNCKKERLKFYAEKKHSKMLKAQTRDVAVYAQIGKAGMYGGTDG